MDWHSIGEALGQVATAALSAFLVATAVPLGLLAMNAARWFAARLKVTLTAQQEHEIQLAAERGVLRAADQLRGVGAGAQKKALAIATAQSLAPKSFAELPVEQQAVLVQATYAKLRPSLQTPSQMPPPGGSLAPPTLSFPPGTVIQVMEPAVPRPARMPTDLGESQP